MAEVPEQESDHNGQECVTEENNSTKERPWIAEISGQRGVRKAINEMLNYNQLKSDKELDRENKMLQHRKKCKSMRRIDAGTELNISKALLLRKRV